jgi:hypothetical protein
MRCFEDLSEWSPSHGFLTLHRWVCIFEGFEEGFEGCELVLSSQDVKGAPLEIVPKCLSQTACGNATSVSGCCPSVGLRRSIYLIDAV